jgi:MFS family permease
MSALVKTAEETPAMPPIPLWRIPGYLTLWGGQIVSSVGSQVSQMALPLLVLAVTHSPAQAGIMGALRGGAALLLALPAGAFVDRADRRRVMIVCDSGRALALAAIPLASLGHSLTFAVLALAALVEGALSVFFDLAETGALANVVPGERLPAAIAQNSMTASVAQTAGPALSGLLYGIHALLPFVADAGSYLFSVWTLALIRVPFQQVRTNDGPTHLGREIREGMACLWGHPVIRFLALTTGGLMLFSAGYPLILILLAQRAHMTPLGIGLLFGSGGIGSILGALLAERLQRRYPTGPLMIWAIWFWVLTWLPYAFAPTPLLLGLANIAGFVIVPVFFVIQSGYRLALTPDALQGRVNSVFRLVAFGTQPLGLALAGVLLQAFGPVRTVLMIVVPQFLLCIAATLYGPLRRAGKAA